MAQVIRAMAERNRQVEAFVRSAAPAEMFKPLPPARVEHSSIDTGMAEEGPLKIDAAGTLRRLSDLLDRREAIVAEEAAAVRRLRPDLLVADIPFLAGDVAEAASVPCVAVSNFTWDWICDPLLNDDPAYAAVRPQIVAGYEKIHSILQLPFGGVSEGLRDRTPVPLIAGRSTRHRGEVLGHLGIEPNDRRPIALVALRGGVPRRVIKAAAIAAPDFLFLTAPLPADDLPENVRPVETGSTIDFSDLVAASDVVISKLGYGIVSDCLASGTALLWPRRTGFREDDVVEAECPRYMRTEEIPTELFFAGDWGAPLRDLLEQAGPAEQIRTDGADVCARLLLDRISSCGPPS